MEVESYELEGECPLCGGITDITVYSNDYAEVSYLSTCRGCGRTRR